MKASVLAFLVLLRSANAIRTTIRRANLMGYEASNASISCPSDFIPDALANAVSFSRKARTGKRVTVYRCNRGLVTSSKTGRTDNPREVEVECFRGPTGGVIAPVNSTCIPGFCDLDLLRTLKYAQVDTSNSSIKIDGTVNLECVKGYTIDGVASGPRSRQLRCDQDTELTPLYEPFEDNECKPVKCGEISDQDNAHIISKHNNMQKIYFNDVVTYECNEGFNFQPFSVNSPIPPGTTSFSFRCDASGVLQSVEEPDSIMPGKCVPAKCPMPPQYNGSDVVAKLTDHVYVGQEVQYVCERSGYFVNSTTVSPQLQRFIPPRSEFRISCNWDQSEKTGVYDTDPAVARCVNGTTTP